MPRVTVHLPSVPQTVTRPVILDMIGQVSKQTGIGDTSKVFFAGDIEKMTTPGSSVDDKNREAMFGNVESTYITIEEDYDKESIGNTAIGRIEHIPVFVDDKLFVRVAPIYTTSNVSINFRYKTASKTAALAWRDKARLRATEMTDVNLHDLTYSYMLPMEILVTLREIHNNREENHGYGQTFESYVVDHSTDRLTLVGDLTGKHANLSIAETQCRVQGFYDFDVLPEKPEREETEGAWLVTFSYRFSYDKPISCYFEYPIMVHNKLLKANFIDFGDSYDLNKKTMSRSLSSFAHNAFELQSVMNSVNKPNTVIRIPHFDDYLLPSINVSTGTIAVILAEVEVTDKRTLFNLNDLGDMLIDPDILKFIKDVEYRYICDMHKSLINLSLYRNHSLTSSGTITCDSNLNIKATSDLDLRNQHRVRLSVVMDITMVTQEALLRLKDHPKTLVKLIGSINELLRNNVGFAKLANKKQISELDFNKLYSFLTGYRLSSGSGNYYGSGIYDRDFFFDIDPRIVENYRKNGRGTNTVMVNKITALPNNKR